MKFGAGRLWNQIVEPAGLTTAFQPIFEIGWSGRSVFALEALTRGPRGTNVERADVLFEYVRRKGREAQVDRLAIAAALREARGLPGMPGLSLNVHASTLEQDRLLPVWLAEQAQEYGIPCHRLIIEIVEHAPPWSGPSFLMSLDRLRGLGVRIALDDVGLGQSNYRMILDCQPDLLKIDRHFVAGAHADPHRRAVLESIADLACRLGGRAVAEGIEDERDLDVALSSGIDLVQGYLLCSPYPSKSLRKLDFMQDTAGPVPVLDRPFEDPSPTKEILIPG
ncbi:MAG TPA: EAL domain-containing protein [Thermoanaerobaculia bacterium]|nr:EAL domain-containing protein [Thermoanaerobaculia bacterium]